LRLARRHCLGVLDRGLHVRAVAGPRAMTLKHVIVVCLALFASRAAAPTLPTPVYGEYRGDAIVGRGTSAQAGIGGVFLMGTYVRTTIDAAGGATWRYDQTRASGRVDAIARFLLDPFREAPLGLSLGGGVSVPYVSGDAHVRPLLTAV